MGLITSTSIAAWETEEPKKQAVNVQIVPLSTKDTMPQIEILSQRKKEEEAWSFGFGWERPTPMNPETKF